MQNLQRYLYKLRWQEFLKVERHFYTVWSGLLISEQHNRKYARFGDVRKTVEAAASGRGRGGSRSFPPALPHAHGLTASTLARLWRSPSHVTRKKSEEKDIRISDCAKSKIASENVLVLKKRYFSAKGLFERLEQ